MKDYDVMYNGIVIGNVKANSLEEATKICHDEYDEGVHGFPTVEPTKGEEDE